MTGTPFVVDASSVTGRPVEDGALIERAVLGAHTGSPWLALSVLELDSGRSCTRATGGAEQVLFVLSGHGTLGTGDAAHTLEPESGAYIPARRRYELSAPSDEQLLFVSVRIPDPVQDGPDPADPVVRRLADQAAGEATSGRRFRIISDPGTGLQTATHFVGYIPPGRARDHFHNYDEVLYVLDGRGAFHAAEESWAVGSGSCIALPARTVHCLENTGHEALRVVAVFRPAGSPAAAYYPDGTPAYDTHEPSDR